jgi:hypothetical protein
MRRGRILSPLLSCLLFSSAQALGQAPPMRIVDWVESAPASDSGSIALGYPVPVPVDTPLPFDGFRSYAGLHARHQDLAVTSPWVHPVALGETRQGRTIWLYQLGDANLHTASGSEEQAMLTNGGIHAREWQSPEVATGIIELLALGPEDHHLLSYLRDNANILVIPVLNVDGFLQTQRFPATNWLGTDPDDPESSPRDGRMRRKNMLGPDEDLMTPDDHLLGVDLNRNSPPYWNTDHRRSSGDENSLVYHGSAPRSEPEIKALNRAVEHGPAARLSMYTDMHSFSQVHFWVRNTNFRLARQTESLLRLFSDFHRGFPAGKNYAFSTATNTPLNVGIGTTDEYFTHTYQVPSWTLEIEPSNGAAYHSPLPGSGADYGGLGRNEHDGFILPESQIARVRSELAETFAVAYYRQSGPPSIAAINLVDEATGAVVFEAEWDALDASNRRLHVFQAQPLQLGRDYLAWIAWDKPMRWRSDGAVTQLPGQPDAILDVQLSVSAGDDTLNTLLGDPRWRDQPGLSPGGYQRYRDDAMAFSLRLSDDETNAGLLQGQANAALSVDVFDFTGTRADADPATVARWEGGGWSGYENSEGTDATDLGGADSTLQFAVTPDTLGDPFVVEPGNSSAWYDPERNGEGFMLEILGTNRALMYWFTYDSNGKQNWYVAEGEIRGNRILFPELLQVSGGQFGPGFDPDDVIRTVVGSASFIWSSCDAGAMEWVIDQQGSGRRQGRMNLRRLTAVMGLECGLPEPLQAPGVAAMSGSWYDPAHSGEGYVLEVLSDQRVLVFWFSFDRQGQRRWFFGTGEIFGESLLFSEMLTTQGARFGAAFDPDDVELSGWGTLQLDLGCNQGLATFEPTEPDFPSGTLNLTRLTRLEGLNCHD